MRRPREASSAKSGARSPIFNMLSSQATIPPRDGTAGGRQWLHDFLQHGENILTLGRIIKVMMIDMSNDPLRINNKNRPLGMAGVSHNAVLLRDLSMRPEIGQQRIIDTAQGFGPRLVTGNRIDRDTQNLGV